MTDMSAIGWSRGRRGRARADRPSRPGRHAGSRGREAVTIISAPAGSGKTSLQHAWAGRARTTGSPVADPVEVEVPDPVRAGLGGGSIGGGHGFPSDSGESGRQRTMRPALRGSADGALRVDGPRLAAIEVRSRHRIPVVRCTGARRLVQDAGAAASLNAQPNSVPVPLALRNSGRQDSTITGIR